MFIIYSVHEYQVNQTTRPKNLFCLWSFIWNTQIKLFKKRWYVNI